jgi:hypothetical protein
MIRVASPPEAAVSETVYDKPVALRFAKNVSMVGVSTGGGGSAMTVLPTGAIASASALSADDSPVCAAHPAASMTIERAGNMWKRIGISL